MDAKTHYVHTTACKPFYDCGLRSATGGLRPASISNLICQSIMLPNDAMLILKP